MRLAVAGLCLDLAAGDDEAKCRPPARHAVKGNISAQSARQDPSAGQPQAVALALETVIGGNLFIALKDCRVVLRWNTGAVILDEDNKIIIFTIQNNVQTGPPIMKCILD